MKYIIGNYNKGLNMYVHSSSHYDLNIQNEQDNSLSIKLVDSDNPDEEPYTTYFCGVELIGIQEMLKDLVPLVDGLVEEYKTKAAK